ncbi:hypothetical protein EHP00_1961 [Ecytonucleospora hepatopenaei]|uniref:Uncharacterized protein n=1 Tax=Ecytonucleospora hepatopenaei TaxID=646526 RepID=A0A1W0E3D6_9MICR|nr:hypothetical protein EHP00_1961 [Ecytonucleospora hepatopenaei]
MLFIHKIIVLCEMLVKKGTSITVKPNTLIKAYVTINIPFYYNRNAFILYSKELSKYKKYFYSYEFYINKNTEVLIDNQKVNTITKTKINIKEANISIPYQDRNTNTNNNTSKTTNTNIVIYLISNNSFHVSSDKYKYNIKNKELLEYKEINKIPLTCKNDLFYTSINLKGQELYKIVTNSKNEIKKVSDIIVDDITVDSLKLYNSKNDQSVSFNVLCLHIEQLNKIGKTFSFEFYITNEDALLKVKEDTTFKLNNTTNDSNNSNNDISISDDTDESFNNLQLKLHKNSSDESTESNVKDNSNKSNNLFFIILCITLLINI